MRNVLKKMECLNCKVAKSNVSCTNDRFRASMTSIVIHTETRMKVVCNVIYASSNALFRFRKEILVWYNFVFSRYQSKPKSAKNSSTVQKGHTRHVALKIRLQ